MAHDNAVRFLYTVLQDCVLPKQDGGMQRLKRGMQVSGPHYERFTKTGVLNRVEAPAPKPVPTVPAPSTPAAAAPAPAPVVEETPQEEEKQFTRQELEALTKRQLIENFAPDWTGTKTDLIEKILKGA